MPLQKVEEKLEYWVDKHENDTDAKDKELNALKESKAKNLEMLQRFASEVRQQQQQLSAHPCKTASCLFCTVSCRTLIADAQAERSRQHRAKCVEKRGLKKIHL